MNSEVTSSLISGRLRGELGVVDAEGELRRIYEAIAATVQVNVGRARRRGNGMFLKLRLTAIPFDLETLLSDAGSYKTDKGTVIPWFKWLTTLGDRVIVRDYLLEINPPRSRTGTHIMVQRGRGWRVPPEFSGTKSNNFVTRATDNILVPLGREIEKIVKRVL
jgi:hypothetical protein